MGIGTFVGMALWALIPGFIAKKKGRSFWGYYFLSFIITPLITMIITLCVSNKEKEYSTSRPNADHRYADSANQTSSNTSDWHCDCGRVHPYNVISCICGKSRVDSISYAAVDGTSSENQAARASIMFCRKCGERLIDNSQFCRKCGELVVEEEYATKNTNSNVLKNKSKEYLSIRFCRKCGCRLSNAERVCDMCGTTASVDRLVSFCEDCDHWIPVDSKYCQYCGLKLDISIPNS